MYIGTRAAAYVFGMCPTRCLDALFDDKRVCVCVLMLWMGFVLGLFKEVGVLDGQFMQLGPSVNTKFMGVVMDTWYKWGLVAGFTFINTTVNDFMSDAISPWMLNTLTDHKTRYIPYPKIVCLSISQIWSVYCGVMGVFGLFLAMSQVDFVLIRLAADLSVNSFTCMKFMRNKVYCVEKYKQHFVPVSSDGEDGSEVDLGTDLESGFVKEGSDGRVELVPLRAGGR